MKRIGDASFFRIVDRLFGTATTRSQPVEWVIDGVAWERERLSYSGRTLGFSIEVTTGRRIRSPFWTLVIVKEYWRKAEGGEGFKILQWAHVTSGRRAAVTAWMKRQEQNLDG